MLAENPFGAASTPINLPRRCAVSRPCQTSLATGPASLSSSSSGSSSARISMSSRTRPLGSGLPAFSNGSSLTIQAWASASSSALAPVPMILAMVTSSTPPTALITSSRVRRFMASHPQAAYPQATVTRPSAQRRAGRIASAARGKPRWILGQDPDFNCREYGDSGADNDMDRHRGGSLETQYPRRNQHPQSYNEI